MPHQCTNCERVFADGSKEMLSGCPDCGGSKFQFKPDSATDTAASDDDDRVGTVTASDPPDTASDPMRSSDADTADPTPTDAAAPTTTSPPSSAADSEGEVIETESDPNVLDPTENSAQADARRDVVTRDELDDVSDPPQRSDDPARTIPPDTAASPGIDDLREELNDQFESIKILEPGQYELNLMELYDRQECIISLQEDGHYVIEVADAWRDDA
ncbi:OapC/ArvC family zinc-ribbon domain-containing protein [Haloplanus sp.]|uniref:OapC/ArvC family zinc-ribbon domain-containing protein n=1 Tax=Haloplanus sp. TaxID=1961696 RepID=UPI00262155FB|nr:Zn-ribbon containing protein [Haloplanus sp.]